MPYWNLDVYRKAYDLALEIHRNSLNFPKHEQHELASQLRRASKSIPVNLVEGMGKHASSKDVKRYIKIAMGSNDEVRLWLKFSKDLSYLPEESYQDLSVRYEEVGKMLGGLLKRYT
tara:strand:- start:113 stop:463 length:351 start_codon:yes stop_codon:yes gene_type:complete